MAGEFLPPRTALCIDDDPQLLSVEKLYLEAHGYRVLTASSGTHGLRILRTQGVDAVVLDMDGLMLDTEPLYKVAGQQAARDLGQELDDAS